MIAHGEEVNMIARMQSVSLVRFQLEMMTGAIVNGRAHVRAPSSDLVSILTR